MKKKSFILLLTLMVVFVTLSTLTYAEICCWSGSWYCQCTGSEPECVQNDCRGSGCNAPTCGATAYQWCSSDSTGFSCGGYEYQSTSYECCDKGDCANNVGQYNQYSNWNTRYLVTKSTEICCSQADVYLGGHKGDGDYACTTATSFDFSEVMDGISGAVYSKYNSYRVQTGYALVCWSTSTGAARCGNDACYNTNTQVCYSGDVRSLRGAACNVNSDCDDTTNDVCNNNICTQKNSLNIDDACTNNLACISSYCYNNLCKVPDGGTCSANSDCASEACNLNVCITKNSLGTGDACDTDVACSSSYCFLGFCRVPEGGPCSADTDCVSGNCAVDYDGDGLWCAPLNKCSHDSTIYNIGDANSGYICLGKGVWSLDSYTKSEIDNQETARVQTLVSVQGKVKNVTSGERLSQGSIRITVKEGITTQWGPEVFNAIDKGLFTILVGSGVKDYNGVGTASINLVPNKLYTLDLRVCDGPGGTGTCDDFTDIAFVA